MNRPMRGCESCGEPRPLIAFLICDECTTGRQRGWSMSKRSVLAAALLALLGVALIFAALMRGAAVEEDRMDGDAAYPQGVDP